MWCNQAVYFAFRRLYLLIKRKAAQLGHRWLEQKENLDQLLLKSAEVAEKLWKMFEERRRELEEVGDEDQEAEDRDLEWGWGDMGRGANDEGNLAERGYGE